MRYPGSGKRRRPGVSAVEFAFVAPVLFVMVLGIIEIGRACMVAALLTEAARLACRQGVLEGTSGSTIQSTAVNYLNGVGISGETANVYVNDQSASSATVQSMPAYTDIKVVVAVPASNVTWVPPLFVTGTLSGQYTMRRE